MQEDVDDVIGSWVESPRCAFQTERSINERKILGGRVEREPNPFEPVWRRQEIVSGDVFVIVPDKAGVPGREISENDSANEQQAEKPAARGGGQSHGENS